MKKNREFWGSWKAILLGIAVLLLPGAIHAQPTPDIPIDVAPESAISKLSKEWIVASIYFETLPADALRVEEQKIIQRSATESLARGFLHVGSAVGEEAVNMFVDAIIGFRYLYEETVNGKISLEIPLQSALARALNEDQSKLDRKTIGPEIRDVLVDAVIGYKVAYLSLVGDETAPYYQTRSLSCSILSHQKEPEELKELLCNSAEDLAAGIKMQTWDLIATGDPEKIGEGIGWSVVIVLSAKGPFKKIETRMINGGNRLAEVLGSAGAYELRMSPSGALIATPARSTSIPILLPAGNTLHPLSPMAFSKVLEPGKSTEKTAEIQISDLERRVQDFSQKANQVYDEFFQSEKSERSSFADRLRQLETEYNRLLQELEDPAIRDLGKVQEIRHDLKGAAPKPYLSLIR